MSTMHGPATKTLNAWCSFNTFGWVYLRTSVHSYVLILPSTSDPLRFILPFTRATITERQRITVQLTLDGNPLPPHDNFTVTWYKDGVPLDTSQRVQYGVDFVSFNPAYRGDHGLYRIIAENYLGNATVLFPVDVHCKFQGCIILCMLVKWWHWIL